MSVKQRIAVKPTNLTDEAFYWAGPQQMAENPRKMSDQSVQQQDELFGEVWSFDSVVFIQTIFSKMNPSFFLLLLFAHCNLSAKVTSHFPPGNFEKVLTRPQSPKKSARTIRLDEEVNLQIYTLEHVEETHTQGCGGSVTQPSSRAVQYLSLSSNVTQMSLSVFKYFKEQLMIGEKHVSSFSKKFWRNYPTLCRKVTGGQKAAAQLVKLTNESPTVSLMKANWLFSVNSGCD